MNTAPELPIDLLVLDDHGIVRQGVMMLARGLPWVGRCRDAADLAEAQRLMREAPADVAIVDLSLKGASGLDAIGALLAQWPTLRIVVLSMHADPIHHRRALQRGALAFVAKEDASEELAEALSRAVAGEHYSSSSVRAAQIGATPGSGAPEGIDAEVSHLTPRERQVLAMIGRGRTAAEVAAELGRSVKTVEAHRNNLREKLGLRSNQQLLQFSARWVQLDGTE